MADYEERAALNGLEKKLFNLMAKGATKSQWAEWLRAPLEHALADGDQKLALSLLNAGADGGAGWDGCDGRTLLGAAAEGGNHELVSAVLEAGGSEDFDVVSGEWDMSALHHAIAGGHLDAARVLMLAGADVGLVDGRDRSALHYAVEGGHLQLAGNVIIGGADPTAEDAEGDTPLHLAAAHDDTAFVGTLLRRGADVGAKNNEGWRPLHVAVKHDRVAVAEALLKAGANPNVRDGKRKSPLMLARRSLSMTRILLAHGADLKVVDNLGYTALHRAAEMDEADVIEALVEAGADVEAQSGGVSYTVWGGFKRLTPLHVAALLCCLRGISALLIAGADVNAVDRNDQTPLHLLCSRSVKRDDPFSTWSEDQAADLLLRWGADETLTDNDGRTPKQLIKRAGTTKRLQKVLANAPADRAWRRRGMLVMCRAFPDKVQKKGSKGRAGKAKAGRGRGRGRGRGGSSAGRGRGKVDVLTRVVELEDDEIFRAIIGFL